MVLFLDNFSIASCTIFSDTESKEEVASSINKICGSLRTALAIEILCFCPPDSFPPPSPILVLYFCFSFTMKLCAFDVLAADIISSKLCFSFPKLILLITVSLNSIGSWVTSPIELRKDRLLIFFMFTPSIKISPLSTS